LFASLYRLQKDPSVGNNYIVLLVYFNAILDLFGVLNCLFVAYGFVSEAQKSLQSGAFAKKLLLKDKAANCIGSDSRVISCFVCKLWFYMDNVYVQGIVFTFLVNIKV